jgi:DNA primase
MPGIDFRLARSQVRLAEVLELLGFAPSGGGGQQLRGPCPVHRSRTPRSRSFAAHLGRGVWRCFRCGAGGNVLDLWAAVSGQPIHTAVIDLYTRLGRAVPWRPRPAGLTDPTARGEKRTMPDT